MVVLIVSLLFKYLRFDEADIISLGDLLFRHDEPFFFFFLSFRFFRFRINQVCVVNKYRFAISIDIESRTNKSHPFFYNFTQLTENFLEKFQKTGFAFSFFGKRGITLFLNSNF